MAAFSFGVMAAGIAGRLLTSGLQRVGTLTFQKAMRISRIEHTLKGVPLRNPQVKAASDDFITLIGNRYGEYTEQLSKFLEELERSGLITAMVENALVDRKSEEVRKAFVLLHARVINPNEDDAISLYEKMMVSFAITFREVSKDKNTHAVLQLISRNVASRFDQVDSALQALNKQLPRAQHSSVQGMQPALLKLVRGLQAVTKQVRIETNKGARSVDISKIYIPPKLKYRDTAKNADLISNAASVVRAKRQRSDASELVEWRVDPTSLNTIGYGDLKLSFSRVVILGDPGGGKSTICQNLCFDLAKQAAGALLAANKPSAQLQKFPIRVVLRAFEKARTVNPQLSLFDFIIRDLINHVSLDFEELREAVLYLLTTGAAVLAFDGLDEILATAQRREFVDLVLSFCNQYPLCPVVVTSRLVGYDSAPLTGEFEELVLERFDENEILNYLTKFFKVVGERTEAESSQYAQDFLRQTASNASDLRANPLMLGLMAWLFNARGDVPSNRPEIYRECAILMFERWDPDRDIKADVPSDFDKLHLFSSIAANMFGDPELADGVEEAWLSAEIKRYLEALYENKSQATAGTKAVVKFITGRAWVMTDVGENVFAFTHQTFLEYFFARHIDEKADSVEEVLGEIIPHVVVKEWDVVAHLSLQIKTHRSLRRQNQAIEQLIELINATSSVEERMSLNLFAARALEYLNASESQVKSLVERIFNEAVENGEPNDAFLAIRHCAYCCAERRTFVRSLLLELIVSTFKKGETRQLERLARAMSSVRTGGAVKTAVIPPEIQSAAHQAVKRMVIDRSGESEFFAGLAWSWYGHLTEALLRKFGIAHFYNGTLEANPFFIDGLTHLVLAGSDQFSAEFPLLPEAAREALVAVGRVGFSTPVEGKQRFNRPPIRGGAPLTFWKSVLGQYKKFPEALIGVFFIFLLVSEFDGDEEQSDPQASEFRGDVIEAVLKSRALKKAPAYEDIARIARAPIFDQPKGPSSSGIEGQLQNEELQ